MSLTLIWPFNDIQGQILSGKLKGHIYMTYYMYFIQTPVGGGGALAYMSSTGVCRSKDPPF